MKAKFILPIMSLGLAFGCSDDENPPAIVSRDFTVTVSNIQSDKSYFQSGVFNTPVGDSGAGPATPGKSYQFSFYAGAGHRLSFVTMFVQSNDLFYAPAPEGIELFQAGVPISGDITSMISLWDAGTEVNEEPGVGANQAPRQSGPNTGDDENGTVTLIANVGDGFTYPDVSSVIRVTISNQDEWFTVNIENISDGSSLPTPFAPGVFVVHSGGTPLFEADQADFGDGLEGIAEDGDPSAQAAVVSAETGLITPMAPGAFVIHPAGMMPLFTNGSPVSGNGLEAVAEDGDPSGLAASLAGLEGVGSSGAFNTPVGASGPGPLLPGGSYEFAFTAEPGDYLSFATMFVQSNDLFYGFGDSGLALFSGDLPSTGDVTSSLMLWDAGTEVNEFPGAGANQAPRQSGPNTGADENGNIQVVNDGFDYPATSSVISVTITAN